MATELTAKRLAELRKLQRRALDNPVAFAADYVSAIADDGDALLRAAEERDELRRQLEQEEIEAIEDYRHASRLRQLWRDAFSTTGEADRDAIARVIAERDRLRAQRDAAVAVLQSGQSLRTHDIDTTERWVIDDVDEVREAIRAAKENQ